MWNFPVRNTVHSQGVPKISYVQNFQSCCLLKFSKKVSILHIVGIVLLGTMMDSDQRICFLPSVLVTLWREYLFIITITSTLFYLFRKIFWSKTHSYSHMREVAGTEAIIFPHAIIFPVHHNEKLTLHGSGAKLISRSGPTTQTTQHA